MLFNKTNLMESIGDIDSSYNSLGGINTTRDPKQ